MCVGVGGVCVCVRFRSILFFAVLLRGMANSCYKYSLNQSYREYFTTEVESFFGCVLLPLFLHLQSGKWVYLCRPVHVTLLNK